MTINSQNISGVTATIVGNAAASPENPPYDKEGTRGFKQLRLGVSQGYTDKNTGEWVERPTLWVTVNGRDEDFPAISKGDKVRVDEARFEAREYERKDGTIGQAFETRFGRISVVESKSQGGNQNPDYQPF